VGGRPEIERFNQRLDHELSHMASNAMKMQMASNFKISHSELDAIQNRCFTFIS